MKSEDYDYKVSNGFALIDKPGKVLMLFGKYDIVSDPQDGVIIISKGYEKTGLMNFEGQVIMPLIYPAISDFDSNRAYMRIWDSSELIIGYINRNGKVVIKMKKDVGY